LASDGVAGYCPGTSLGAVGEGRWMAFGNPRMLAGERFLLRFIRIKINSSHVGKLWINHHASSAWNNHWLIIIIFIIGGILLFRWFEKKDYKE